MAVRDDAAECFRGVARDSLALNLLALRIDSGI